MKSKLLLTAAIILTLSGCTQNERVKKFGGTMKIQVPKGQRVRNITWKGDDLWYSTTPMDSSYVPRIHTFQENSSFGILEGKIILIESR